MYAEQVKQSFQRVRLSLMFETDLLSEVASYVDRFETEKTFSYHQKFLVHIEPFLLDDRYKTFVKDVETFVVTSFFAEIKSRLIKMVFSSSVSLMYKTRVLNRLRLLTWDGDQKDFMRINAALDAMRTNYLEKQNLAQAEKMLNRLKEVKIYQKLGYNGRGR